MGEKNVPVWAYELALVSATIMWGLSFVVLKGALDVVGPSWLLTIRFALSIAVLVVVFHRRLAENLDWSHVVAGFVVGIPEGLAFVIQNAGLTDTTPGKNAFLTATYCVMVPLMAWVVTKRRPRLNNLVAALLCAAGVAFISLRGEGFFSPTSLYLSKGDVLTLVSAVFFAMNIVAVDRVGGTRDSITLTVTMFVVCLLTCLPFLPFEPMPDFGSLGLDFWAQLGYVVVFATVVALVIQNTAQKHVPPAQASLLLSLESVFAVIFSVALYGERLSVELVTGFALVFAGVVVSQLAFGGKSRKDARKSHTLA